MVGNYIRYVDSGKRIENLHPTIEKKKYKRLEGWKFDSKLQFQNRRLLTPNNIPIKVLGTPNPNGPNKTHNMGLHANKYNTSLSPFLLI